MLFLLAFISYDLMVDCWKTDPSGRPSFTDISNRLRQIIQQADKGKRQFNPPTRVIVPWALGWGLNFFTRAF